MKTFNFEISKSLCELEGFSEASQGELRVLIALMELGGRGDEETLAKMACVSPARCASAITLWESLGALKATPESNLSYEFQEREGMDEPLELEGLEVAEGVRDGNLADLITECARLVGKPLLSALEIKRLTAAYVEFSLTPEYIATLAAYLAEDDGFTISKLLTRIRTITKSGILTEEDLLEYISTSEKDKEMCRSISRTLRIYGRPLTSIEKRYGQKWMDSFGFSLKIIEMAYEITMLHINKLDMRYLDAILTSWHKAGCKTLEDCERVNSSEGERIKNQYNKKAQGKEKKEKNVPRYGTFDPEAAFKQALERSFPGFDGNNKTEDK